MHTRLSDRDIRLGDEIASRGEGAIMKVIGDQAVVAKIYFDPPDDLGPRLDAMMASAPAGNLSKIAWPTDVIEDAGCVVGYLQPNLDGCVSLLEALSNQAPRWVTQKALLGAARDVAVTLGNLHSVGYLFPDLHAEQVLLGPKIGAVLVDAASCQFLANGYLFACCQALPESQPPELLGSGSWQDVATQRSTATDVWSLATLIFQCTMKAHPFDGIDSVPGRRRVERLRDGVFPYSPAQSSVVPPARAPAYDGVVRSLRQLFERCFVDGHSVVRHRPTAAEWADALTRTSALRHDSGKAAAVSSYEKRNAGTVIASNDAVVVIGYVLLLLWLSWARQLGLNFGSVLEALARLF